MQSSMFSRNKHDTNLLKINIFQIDERAAYLLLFAMNACSRLQCESTSRFRMFSRIEIENKDSIINTQCMELSKHMWIVQMQNYDDHHWYQKRFLELMAITIGVRVVSSN